MIRLVIWLVELFDYLFALYKISYRTTIIHRIMYTLSPFIDTYQLRIREVKLSQTGKGLILIDCSYLFGTITRLKRESIIEEFIARLINAIAQIGKSYALEFRLSYIR